MKVKVCGITNYEDAALAIELGADALGFNFYKGSPRYIDPAKARKIIWCLPPFAISVGVFVNVPQPEDVIDIARFAGVQVLQLHGGEDPAYCSRLRDWPLIKAVRIGEEPIDEGMVAYAVQAFLLDSKENAMYGGTGKTFKWERALEYKEIRPVILAGGLRPENVAEAIRAVDPYAVDVCSGVEYAPGRKDAQKLEEFMNEVRNGSDTLQRS